jgi:hypothetical protein
MPACLWVEMEQARRMDVWDLTKVCLVKQLKCRLAAGKGDQRADKVVKKCHR